MTECTVTKAFIEALRTHKRSSEAFTALLSVAQMRKGTARQYGFMALREEYGLPELAAETQKSLTSVFRYHGGRPFSGDAAVLYFMTPVAPSSRESDSKKIILVASVIKSQTASNLFSSQLTLPKNQIQNHDHLAARLISAIPDQQLNKTPSPARGNASYASR